MGCAKCGGGGTGKRCCLCSLEKAENKYKWGATRIVCRKCKEKMEREMKENENFAIRTRTLLAGKNFEWKDLEKWKKYWYVQSVEKL